MIKAEKTEIGELAAFGPPGSRHVSALKVDF
jgi:hypothetical protein